jgi:hypothetical protein
MNFANAAPTPFVIATKHSTTTGTVRWDDGANHVVSADCPVPPDNDPAWEMEGVVLSELRLSQQTIIWFWKKTYLVPPLKEEHGA